MSNNESNDQNSWRQISADELRLAILAHESWLANGRVEGEGAFRADLSKVDLRPHSIPSGTNLSYALISRSNLTGCSITGVKLEHADLSGATAYNSKFSLGNSSFGSLRHANFAGADLRLATFFDLDCFRVIFANVNLVKSRFVSCGLEGANFQEADLRDSRLESTLGSSSDAFAGATLTGAHLPEHLHVFEGIKQAKDLSTQAKRLFVTILFAIAYSLLTIAMTRDPALLTNSSTFPLPIVGAVMPIAWFYKAAPLLLISLWIYLHLYLQRLWDEISSLPSTLTDGRAIDRGVYPWILSAIIRIPQPRLFKGQRGTQSTTAREIAEGDLAALPTQKERRLVYLEALVAIFLGWFAVPMTLAFFWLRYIPLHDSVGTFLHIIYMSTATGFAVMFCHLAFSTLWRCDRLVVQSLANKSPTAIFGKLRFLLSFVAGTACMILVSAPLSSDLIDGGPVAARQKASRSVYDIPQYTGPFDEPFLSLKPRVIPAVLKDSLIQRRQLDTDSAPSANKLLFRLGYDVVAELFEQDVSIKPQNWSGDSADLPLVKGARLVSRDLKNTVAYRTFLANADLRNSKLDGANIYESDLRGANLSHSTGRNVRGWRIKFQKSEMSGANFAHSTFDEALFSRSRLLGLILDSCSLVGAAFVDADMKSASLIGADLRYTNFSGADLSGADLSGANLTGAWLSRTKLEKTRLQGATFTGAKISATSFLTADVTDADFRGASVDFESGTFRPLQLDSAIFTPEVYRMFKAVNSVPTNPLR